MGAILAIPIVPKRWATKRSLPVTNAVSARIVDAMRIAHSFQRRRELGASMTPMIDVVFLLLIFFVCTASFQIIESTLSTNLLAEGTTQVELPPELQLDDLDRIVITVDDEAGSSLLQLNGQPCPSATALSEWLDIIVASDGAELPVVIDPSDAALVGNAIDVYDRCKLSGFARVQFAIEKQ
jgi:biopolymer transport protein ExbD